METQTRFDGTAWHLQSVRTQKYIYFTNAKAKGSYIKTGVLRAKICGQPGWRRSSKLAPTTVRVKFKTARWLYESRDEFERRRVQYPHNIQVLCATGRWYSRFICVLSSRAAGGTDDANGGYIWVLVYRDFGVTDSLRALGTGRNVSCSGLCLWRCFRIGGKWAEQLLDFL